MDSELIGIIPAAGLGTRMGGGSEIGLPKALVKINGHTLLETAIASLKAIGVSKIIIVVGYLGEAIRDFVSARNFGIRIEFTLQERQLGLAHAIATARDFLTTDFVVLCPDNIFSEPDDLIQARQTFLANHPLFLMAATVNPTHQHDRAKYFTSELKNFAPHIYEYHASSEGSGISLTSTGLTFFAREALTLLPSFDNIKTEVRFEEFINALAARGD